MIGGNGGASEGVNGGEEVVGRGKDRSSGGEKGGEGEEEFR